MSTIVALLDMDCFYVQVHQRQEPDTWGTPCAVVQYTGGGVIAVNYEAREYGIKRGFRVEDCKSACSSIRLFRVPELRGKADLTIYRNASIEVFGILSSYDARIVVQRASIDEAFLDVTNFVNNVSPDHRCLDEDISQVHIAGVSPSTTDHFMSMNNYDPMVKTEENGLIIAAKVMMQLKNEIRSKLGFSCSSGISRNKIMSKLACGFKKPNGLSIFSKAGLEEVWKKTPIKKVRNLGGKLGAHLMSHFQIEMMSDLYPLTFNQLESAVGSKSAEWISGILKGEDDEQVSSRLVSKSVGCGKNFNGLNSLKDIKHWITQLSTELVERLIEDQRVNQRRATSMIFGIRFKNHDSFTKTLPLRDYIVDWIYDEVMKIVTSKLCAASSKSDEKTEPIASLYLTASKFVDEEVILNSAVHKTARLDRYFTSINKSNISDIRPELVSICDSEEEEEVGIEDDVQVLMDGVEEGNGTASESEVEIEEITPTCFNDSNQGARRGFFYRKTLQLINKREVTEV